MNVSRIKRQDSPNAGVAMVVAVTALFLFVVLGTAYVNYMSSERRETEYDLRVIRASHLAEGGVMAAVGEIQAALRAGETPQTAFEFQIPVRGADPDLYDQRVSVEVIDESGLVNLNHAPRELLEALGMAREHVRDLKSRLPREGETAGQAEGRRWLTSVAELRQRKIIDSQEYDALPVELFTVYGVAAGAEPRHSLNINAAPPAVLAAIFGLSAEEADAMAARRPFASWDQALEASGKSREALNLPPSDDGGLPNDLALNSNCYRIRSTAAYTGASDAGSPMYRSIEAVVIFREGGSYTFQAWREAPWLRVGEPEPVPAPGAEAAALPSAAPDETETPEGTAPGPTSSETETDAATR